MTDEPRRYKMSSELDDAERAAASRLGSDGRTERPEYVRWRRDVLADERDDLPLRLRLLEEQAEVLRTRAGAQRTDALEELTPDDWFARAEGNQDPLPDGGAAELEGEAQRLEREASEVAQFLADSREAA